MAAFGFSVGDFFSATTLILQATKALRESDAARAECQEAAAFLECVERTLRRVASVMSPDGDPEAYRDVIPYAEACRKQVIMSLDRFKKYESRLTDVSEGLRPAWQKVEKMLVKNKMKLKWVFATKEDLAQIRAAVTPQLELLQLSMQYVEMRRTATIAERQNSLLAMTQSIHTRLDVFISGSEPNISTEAARRLPLRPHNPSDREERIASRKAKSIKRSSSAAVPRSYAGTTSATHGAISAEQVISMIMLYIWQSLHRIVLAMISMSTTPSFLLDTNIHVQDVLGRSLSLPYEHFRHWPVLMARLEVAFEGCPGEDKVMGSQYAMFTVTTRGNGSIHQLDGSNWASNVRRGQTLIMSMSITANGQRLDQCPRCGSSSEQSGQIGWSSCPACNITHRVQHPSPNGELTKWKEPATAITGTLPDFPGGVEDPDTPIVP
ncbi:hypothetical protein LTR10_006400 [Elasticomyces elasticus]|nr:hypothetical protein LTR10_006400 [Elasticomyces elasticus]KAK4966553.1 hypothetical protein LTR42_010863 [Elasticomyces elasticus]